MLKKIKQNHLLWCFLIPLIILLIYQTIIWFYGKMIFAANDCYYQYIPFYELLYQKVKDGSSLIFSDKGSLGVNFYGIYCYYLSSPLNFLIFLFPEGFVPYIVNSLIILKLALSGLSFGYYLNKKFETTKYLELYSCIWVFSGYFAGYLWNVMWLDVLIWVPLIFLSMDELIYEKKSLKYLLSLCVAIISNYFIGFIICIFLFFRFFTMKFTSIKHFFLSGIRFAINSFISALMSCFIIFPTFFTLQQTAIADESIKTIEKGWFTNFFEILKGFMFGEISNAITKYDYKANIYVSLFIVLTFFIYLNSRNIKLIDKIRKIFLLILIFVSFNSKVLNFIWHGFHEQNGIPNRFAFLATILLLECSYEIILQIKEISIKEKLYGFIGTLIFFYLICTNNENTTCSFLITLLFILIYFLFLLWDRIFIILILSECIAFFIASSLNVSVDGVAFYNYYYESFEKINETYDNHYYREKMAAVDNLEESSLYSLKNNIVNFEQKDFINYSNLVELRDKWLNIGYNTTSNECTYFGLNNASMFNTFTHHGLQKFMFKTGNIGSENTIRLSRDNVFLDMFLGVKYDYIGINIDEKYNDNFSYQYLETINNLKVYENKYALSLGYLIDENLIYDDIKNLNQFDALNKISKQISGIEIFKAQSFEIVDYIDCEVPKKEGFYQSFTRKGNDVVIGHEYIVDEDRNDYMYLHFNNLKKVRIFINNALILENKISQNMIEIGELKKGDKVRIEIYSNNNSIDYRYNLFLYSLDQDKFIECYNKLKNYQLEILEYEEGYIKGKITAVDNKKLLITIPYTNNWNVYLNGTKIEPQLFCETFICLNLEEGENLIELEYKDSSFKLGILLSILGVSLACIYYWFNFIINKQKQVKKK